MAGLEHARSAVDLRIGIIEIGIVTDLARREIEAANLFRCRRVRCHGPGNERLDGGVITVDVLGGNEINGILFALQNPLRGHAGAAARRPTGCSRIGRFTTAAKMPSATASHHTASYEPVRS